MYLSNVFAAFNQVGKIARQHNGLLGWSTEREHLLNHRIEQLATFPGTA
jgi:hypothetical protein